MIYESILVICILACLSISVMAYLFKADLNNQVINTAKYLLPIFIILFTFRSFAFEAFKIPSESMSPTLIPGDYILVDKYSHGLRIPLFGTRITKSGTPKRGDVVVFRGIINNKYQGIIKRIVGLPGDHIQYKNQVLYINEKPVIYKDLRTEISKEDNNKITPLITVTETLDDIEHDVMLSHINSSQKYNFDDLIVPEKSYFVIGDNRNNSSDSRYWGVLEDRKIVGKARLIWFSYDWKNNKFRWTRVGEIN